MYQVNVKKRNFYLNSIKGLLILTLKLLIHIYPQNRVTFERQNAINSYLSDTHMLLYCHVFEKMLENKNLFRKEQKKAMNQGNVKFMSLRLMCPKHDGFAVKGQTKVLD